MLSVEWYQLELRDSAPLSVIIQIMFYILVEKIILSEWFISFILSYVI